MKGYEMKKVWSKFQAGVTAVVVGEPDHRGVVPGYISDPSLDSEGRPLAALLQLNEWSEVETVPVPLSVPDVGYVVIYGPDVTDPIIHYFTQETDAAVAVSKDPDAFGYAPVSILRNGMVPRQDED